MIHLCDKMTDACAGICYIFIIIEMYLLFLEDNEIVIIALSWFRQWPESPMAVQIPAAIFFLNAPCCVLLSFLVNRRMLGAIGVSHVMS